MRYSFCLKRHAHVTDSLCLLQKRELDARLHTPEPYHEFGAAIAAGRPALRDAFGVPGLHGWGASAKGNTLLNFVQADLPVIYDEASIKHGLLTPGRHIPVAPLPDSLVDVEALAL